MTAERSLAPLFAPASVAVVGASDDPRKWGNWLARGAVSGESRRPAYLVNRRGGEIFGRPAYHTLSELPEPPELVVLAVPMATLEEAVDSALAAGARAIVAISAGASDSAATAALDATLAARVRAAGAVMLGPNCLGVVDNSEGLELAGGPLPPGPIGLISQSGNLALELGRLAAEDDLGFSRFVSLGNQADLDATEILLALAEHSDTRLLALYVEDFRDGRAFARAARDVVRAGKPVIVLAVEAGEATTRAARSHTGALASGGAAVEAAFRAAGIERVRTPRELIELAQALLRSKRSAGGRLAVLADGGGHGIIAAGLVGAAGLELPVLGADTVASLREQLPATAALTNPVDLAGAAEQDARAFDRTAEVILGSGEVDALLVTGYFGGYGAYTSDVAESELEAARRLGRLAHGTGRPIVAHTMYPQSPAAHLLREVGVPTYASVDQAVAVLRRLATVTSVSAAGQAAREIGYPVVLKALGLLHKSDAGGVVIGLVDEAALVRAYARLERRLAPPAFSVEALAPLSEGIELLIGARWDARFGPIAVAGAGGIYAEILRDSAVALAPIDEEQAKSMLCSLRSAPLLLGARGRPPLAVDAAARALVALAHVAAIHPEFSEIEVNPLLVTGTEAIALDARVVRAAALTHEGIE